ncbi:MAG: sigma-54 dependent transcriptional regulator [Acidobacteriaceae bacterium]
MALINFSGNTRAYTEDVTQELYLRPDGFAPDQMLMGRSPAIERTRQQIQDAAAIDVAVLISGESGTGKDLAARMLHQMSRRGRHTMVKINCPAIPGQLFESELFGHEPGAFTGARSARPGKFEQANNGTLFLDEIGELDMALQSKLLRAVQDFKIVRLGGVEEREVNVRLICGTNRNLEEESKRGAFRSDLYYRINVIHIEMPTLRSRAEDVPLLFQHFVRIYSNQYGRRPDPITPSAMRILEQYHWPGNMRELENLAKRYVVLGGEEHVLSALRDPREEAYAAMPAIDLNTPLRIQTKRAVQSLERRIILDVLRAHKWNRRKAARSLDISYRALLYKIKEAGLPPIRTVKARPAVDEVALPEEPLIESEKSAA